VVARIALNKKEYIYCITIDLLGPLLRARWCMASSCMGCTGGAFTTPPPAPTEPTHFLHPWPLLAVAKSQSFKSQAGIGLQIVNPTDEVGTGQADEPQVDPQPTPTAQEVEESLRRELERLADEEPKE
jgi:hypothetical protein